MYGNFISLIKETSPTRLPFSCRFLLLLLPVLALFVVDGKSLFAATWQADFTIRVSSPRTQTIFFSGKFYQSGAKVRIEPKNSDEIDLFDFEAKIGFRIFPKDRIYFTSPLSAIKIIKAIKEGWITAPLPYLESKVLLWTGDIKGKAGRLYFVILSLNNQKSYVLRWLTDDADELPLRIIYPGPANETIIVDYEPLLSEHFSDNHFTPPTDYLSLNPF